MEIILTTCTWKGLDLVQIDTALKPITVEDHIVLAYLQEHPEVVVKYPFDKSDKSRKVKK